MWRKGVCPPIKCHFTFCCTTCSLCMHIKIGWRKKKSICLWLDLSLFHIFFPRPPHRNVSSRWEPLHFPICIWESSSFVICWLQPLQGPKKYSSTVVLGPTRPRAYLNVSLSSFCHCKCSDACCSTGHSVDLERVRSNFGEIFRQVNTIFFCSVFFLDAPPDRKKKFNWLCDAWHYARSHDLVWWSSKWSLTWKLRSLL